MSGSANDPVTPAAPTSILPTPFAIVGAGRLGSAMAAALRASGIEVSGPHVRGYTGRAPDGTTDAVVVLCVPDDAIAVAAELVVAGPLLAHCSGVSTLAVLGGRGGFSVHPLFTVTRAGTDFRGAWAAVAGSSPTAIEVADQLANALGLHAVRVADADRAAYHAAASMAANFLVTLESAAEAMMSTAGLDRAALLPLAREALENWGRLGSAALTGPVARGDAGTLARHRVVVRTRTPQFIELFDVLVAATQQLAAAQQLAADQQLANPDQPAATRPPAVRWPAGEPIQSEASSADRRSSGDHRPAGDAPTRHQPDDDVESTSS